MPLDDYIIAAFCLIDDLYTKFRQNYKARKAGFAPIINDSEMITMLIVGEFLGLADNSKIWLYFKSNYLHYFPSIEHETYKIFNKQAANLWHIMRILHSYLLDEIGVGNLFLADGFPLPVCHYARASRSTLFKDKAAFSYCAAKKEHYYGFKVLLVTTESGIPIDYVVDSANIDERELLLHANLPEASQVIGDKGFIGEEFANELQQHSQAQMITRKRSNMLKQIPKELSSLIGRVRKRIETCISQLTERFNAATTKARSYYGFLGRLNRKILAYTIALFFNYQIVKDQFTQLELLIQA